MYYVQIRLRTGEELTDMVDAPTRAQAVKQFREQVRDQIGDEKRIATIHAKKV